ncbi:MAG TPA: RNA polymerase-binding protein DksA [Macromonas sp.]|nr:RNA polymerase-binding protein DksA [Macromonas sp.]
MNASATQRSTKAPARARTSASAEVVPETRSKRSAADTKAPAKTVTQSRPAAEQQSKPAATKKAAPSARKAPAVAAEPFSGTVKTSYTPIQERAMTTTAPARKDTKLTNQWKTKSLEALTDEEVLAMPDGEYMNDVQLAYFKRKLQQLKQDILANAGETTEHLREDTVVVPDPADRATIEEEHALELRTRDRERKLLKKIEQALARIDAGDYGYCDETGEPIGVGRLLARPTANLSIEAQQRRELKQKLFGD